MPGQRRAGQLVINKVLQIRLKLNKTFLCHCLQMEKLSVMAYLISELLLFFLVWEEVSECARWFNSLNANSEFRPGAHAKIWAEKLARAVILLNMPCVVSVNIFICNSMFRSLIKSWLSVICCDQPCEAVARTCTHLHIYKVTHTQTI